MPCLVIASRARACVCVCVCIYVPWFVGHGHLTCFVLILWQISFGRAGFSACAAGAFGSACAPCVAGSFCPAGAKFTALELLVMFHISVFHLGSSPCRHHVAAAVSARFCLQGVVPGAPRSVSRRVRPAVSSEPYLCVISCLISLRSCMFVQFVWQFDRTRPLFPVRHGHLQRAVGAIGVRGVRRRHVQQPNGAIFMSGVQWWHLQWTDGAIVLHGLSDV